MPGAMNRVTKLKKGRPLEGHTNVGPTVTITAFVGNPTENVATPGYKATATDPEQGDISSSIVWTEVAGSPAVRTVLATGANVTLTFTSTGGRTLEAKAVDSYGDEDTDTESITVLSAEA